LNLAQVGRVCVTVADTDRAIDFYVDTLGFEKVVDVPMGDAGRWVEVALPGTATTIALAPPPEGTDAGGSQTGIAPLATASEAPCVLASRRPSHPCNEHHSAKPS
jgi:catechol 2,3-dioxygenase-like lactoylglutathione lyase family enzyme